MGRFNLLFISCSVLINFWLEIGPVEAILGGIETESQRHKYIVAVFANRQYVCVGTAIGKYHVLTAGHCVVNQMGDFIKKKFKIVAGVVNLSKPEVSPFKTDVIEAYVPREYRGIILDFYDHAGDLAVLKVKDEFSSNRVEILNLPSKFGPEQTYSDYVREMPTVFGFGENKRLSHTYTTVLKERDCKRRAHALVSSKHICAQIPFQPSDLTRAVCIGDDGAPLMFIEQTHRYAGPVRSRAVVIGILAHYRRDCNEGAESPLYTRITSFVPFIEQAMTGTRDLSVARIATRMPKSGAGSSKATDELIELTR